nr:IncF plasmid conjugative transfer pilus assembly protein TraB [Morganella morganii]
MQFKLTGQLHLPSNQRSGKLENCFVTAATYGDISSERAIVRLQRLSCVINGKHIDTAVKGHVSFYGKNGIKGIPVMRNGQILGLALHPVRWAALVVLFPK